MCGGNLGILNMAHGVTLSNFPKLDDFLRFRKLVWGLRENREIRKKGAEVGFLVVWQAGGEKLHGVMISFEGKGKLELGLWTWLYTVFIVFGGKEKQNPSQSNGQWVNL